MRLRPRSPCAPHVRTPPRPRRSATAWPAARPRYKDCCVAHPSLTPQLPHATTPSPEMLKPRLRHTTGGTRRAAPPRLYPTAALPQIHSSSRGDVIGTYGAALGVGGGGDNLLLLDERAHADVHRHTRCRYARDHKHTSDCVCQAVFSF